jgi:hypothetical protein
LKVASQHVTQKEILAQPQTDHQSFHQDAEQVGSPAMILALYSNGTQFEHRQKQGVTPDRHLGWFSVGTRTHEVHSPWDTHSSSVGSMPGHVIFVLNKVALRQVSSEYVGFPCQFSSYRLLKLIYRSKSAVTATITANASVCTQMN